MATSIAAIRSNPDAEKTGVWKTYPKTDIRVRIARTGGSNSAYENAVRDIRRSQRAQPLLSDPLGVSQRGWRELIAPAVAQHVVLGLENLVDEDGKPIECSPERVEEMLLDPKFDDFYVWILGEAAREASFTDAATAASAKK